MSNCHPAEKIGLSYEVTAPAIGAIESSLEDGRWKRLKSTSCI